MTPRGSGGMPPSFKLGGPFKGGPEACPPPLNQNNILLVHFVIIKLNIWQIC